MNSYKNSEFSRNIHAAGSLSEIYFRKQEGVQEPVYQMQTATAVETVISFPCNDPVEYGRYGKELLQIGY